MNISLKITSTGEIRTPDHQASSLRKRTQTSLTSPVALIRSSHFIKLYLHPEVSTSALIAVIQTIRSLKSRKIEVYERDQHKAVFSATTTPEACFYIGRRCLQQFEQTHYHSFSSHISVNSLSLPFPSDTPLDFTQISALKPALTDTATALSTLPEELTRKVSFYKLDANYNLKLLKLPAIPFLPLFDDSSEFQDIMALPFGHWLNICGQIAIATRKPLRQIGQVSFEEDGQAEQSFLRLIVPFASATERPQNYRVIILSYLSARKSWML